MRRHLGSSAARSRRRSVAGYLTVLKNNFAGTQAAQMSEGPPLTYFNRSRGTCDVTSAVRRSVRRAPTQTSRKQLNASSSGPSNTPRVECGDLEAERTCSSQPRPLGVRAAEARSVNVSAIEQTEPRRSSAAVSRCMGRSCVVLSFAPSAGRKSTIWRSPSGRAR